MALGLHVGGTTQFRTKNVRPNLLSEPFSFGHFDLQAFLVSPFQLLPKSKSQSHERWWGPLLACRQDRLYLCPVEPLSSTPLLGLLRSSGRIQKRGSGGRYSQVIWRFCHKRGEYLHIDMYIYTIVGICMCTYIVYIVYCYIFSWIFMVLAQPYPHFPSDCCKV